MAEPAGCLGGAAERVFIGVRLFSCTTSGLNSGAQGAPIIEQQTELIRLQVGSLLALILASRGLL